MKKLTLREIQQAELSILLEFDKIARENGLKYSLFAGTMLGAVRHKGFIPWDDDIDITMPRPDYEKLIGLNKTPGFLPDYLKMACFEDGSLDVPFMKIFDTRTKIREKNFKEKTVESLWIDIFPLDGLPESYEEKKKLYKKSLMFSKLNVAAAVKTGYGTTRAKVVLKAVFVKPAALLMGRHRIGAIQKKLASRFPYGKTPECGLTVWGYDGPDQALTVSEYEDLIEMEFEGCSFLCTSAWDKNLKGIFGDYMKLPPENERITHDMEAYLL
ncbi:MAG: LicD family protein [Parasporobacterium sp.]|nr:LicD family protein [Parasporobacterium sp.]